MRTIVIAWVDKTGLQETDEYERFDGVNWSRKFKVIPEGKAAIWLNKGTIEDVARAKEYAKTLDHLRVEVYDLPITEQKPLELARSLVLNGFE